MINARRSPRSMRQQLRPGDRIEAGACLDIMTRGCTRLQ
jgi:hypothetical protein